jgi:hypothetical protein
LKHFTKHKNNPTATMTIMPSAWNSSMAIAVTVLLCSSTTLGAGLQVIDNFLVDTMEIEGFLDAASSEDEVDEWTSREGCALAYISQAPVGPSFFGRILQALSPNLTSSCEYNESYGHDDGFNATTTLASIASHIRVKTIHQGATPLHHDCLFHDRTMVEDYVGFIFLNDNDQASFVHGSNSVTPQKGRLVVFEGNVPHQTIVRSGKVNLAGPFRLVTTLDYVSDAFLTLR